MALHNEGTSATSIRIGRIVVVSLIVCLNFSIFSEATFGENQNKLLVELGIRQINWAYSDPQHLSVGLDVKVTYAGSDPPKGVYLTASLASTDPNQIGSMLDLTESLGPWISIGNNQWVLNLTKDNQNLGHLPDYRFSFEKGGNWPNERLNDVIIFSAYTPRTISGKVNPPIAASLTTVNEHPDEHYYYWLWANMPTEGSVILHKEGAEPTPDDPQGCFFSLVLSHELTKAYSFNYVPLLLNTVYPVLMLFLFCAAIFSIIKYYKWIIGSLITVNFSMIILLLTIQFWVKDYVPFWETAVYSTTNDRLMWLLILLATTIIIALIGRPRFARILVSARNRLKKNSDERRKSKHKNALRRLVEMIFKHIGELNCVLKLMNISE